MELAMNSSLMALLDTVKPEHNDKITPGEYEEILRRVASNARLIQPFSGPYRPAWLLNDWQEPVWITYGGKKTRQVDGQWIGTVDVKWSVLLPNGKRLTDPPYATLLETCRRAAVLDREGMGDGVPPALSSWKVFHSNLLALCGWMVLQENRYHFEKYGFALLDQPGLRQLFASLGQGGWSAATRIAERIVDAIHQGTYGKPCPPAVLDALGALPQQMRTDMCHWLASKSAYLNCQSGKKHLSRTFIADLISAPTKFVVGASFSVNAILRQLEPGLAHPHGLLLSSSQATEYPSHRTLTLEAALTTLSSPTPVNHLNGTLRALLALYRHLPDTLPDPATLNLKEARAVGLQHGRIMQRTPFIPINTGLQYLNEAIRWVHRYGDPLVEYYLTLAESLVAATTVGGNPLTLPYSDQLAQVLREVPVPIEIQQAGFRFVALLRGPQSRDFESLRTEPSIHQALKVWAGAVVVVIAMLKPSRETEVSQLSRNCLIGDGPYWLDSDLAKRTVCEYRATTGGKPIPTIAAKAIKQMQRLGDRLSELFGETDEYKRSRLFYLPDFRTFGIGMIPKTQELDLHLDCFCDFVGLPPDELGRRWYLRIHEMRKWFLLLLFWSGRFDVLDAARDIAGHTDINHLYAYIEREFPGVEFAKLEGEYAADRLRHYDQTRVQYEGEIGLNDLYERVLEHFGVEQLELIQERSWESYVQELRDTEAFKLEPYTLTDDQGHQRICVAFRSATVKAKG